MTTNHKQLAGWVKSHYKGFYYEAKLYSDTTYGVNNSNIAKLYIEDGLGNVIDKYDRDWVINPEKLPLIILKKYKQKSKEIKLEKV